MKTFFKFLGIFILFLFGAYFMGPKPEYPNLPDFTEKLPDSLTILESQIQKNEFATKGLKDNNQARIIWADSTKKQKTKIAFLYLHGFSASQEEGSPVHQNIAKRFGANLYLARLAHHGQDLGDSTMMAASTDDFVLSAEKALKIAEKLGEKVIVVGTSFGGSLTAYLASKHPEIQAIILYSPCIEIFDSNAKLLDDPWGLKVAKLVTGSEYQNQKDKNPLKLQYWSSHYHMNGVIAVQNFLTNVMKKETFEKIKCPTLLCYWYKNEEVQDKVVSVKAMLKMYDELGVADDKKRKVNFPYAGNHVIASYITSKEYKNVEKSTEDFLVNSLHL